MQHPGAALKFANQSSEKAILHFSQKGRQTRKSRCGEAAETLMAGWPPEQPVNHPSEHKSLAGDPGQEASATILGGV